MKKLSQRQKKYLLMHSYRLNRRRIISALKQRARRGSDSKVPSTKLDGTDRHGNARKVTRVHLELPENFSLMDNYHEVMAFISSFRDQAINRRRFVYVDFRTLKFIGPDAALLLVAELDRNRRRNNTRLRAQDVEQWDPQVFKQLQEMGIFEVLRVHEPPVIDPDVRPTSNFIPFRTGNKVLGPLAKELRECVERITGKQVARSPLYKGLTEAMANVLHHAYPDNSEYAVKPVRHQWWMCGHYDHASKLLTVIFFDQGVGIPKTLPRKFPKEIILGWLSERGYVDDDGSRIVLAMHIGKTQTGLKHRGKGLNDMRDFVIRSGGGRLRIISGRGEYVFQSDGVEVVKSHSLQLGGTLIEWQVNI